MLSLESIIIKPIETEKTMRQNGVYTFLIHTSATKDEVAMAIEKLYGVRPTSVRTAMLYSKKRMGKKGKPITKRPIIKKAMVEIQGEFSSVAFL